MASDGKDTSEYGGAKIAGAVAAIVGVLGPTLAALTKALEGWQLVTVLLAGLLVAGGGAVALAWKYLDSRTKVKAGAGVLLAALAVPSHGCASFPQPGPYTYDGTRRSGAEYATTVAELASSRSDAFFGTGVTLAALGGAGLATFSAIPDQNLKAGEVPGSGVRAGVTVALSTLVALGAYLIVSSNDLTDLAATVSRAQVWGEDETPGEERDRWLLSLVLEAVADYHGAGADRRAEWAE